MDFVNEWTELHIRGYFKKHPYYQGAMKSAGQDLERIAEFFTLDPEHQCLVLGCGYGRETALIAPKVAFVYALDLSVVLFGLNDYLTRRGVLNWEFVPAVDGWENNIPVALDFAYSYNVFQHLARSTAIGYLKALHKKLKPEGRVLIQFCECLDGGTYDVKPGKVYEPQVNWNEREIRAALALLGYGVEKFKTEPLSQAGHKFLWHWAFFKTIQGG